MLEKKNQVSTIFLYRKINNKKVTDNDLIDWRAYGVETLTKPKQTKPRKETTNKIGISGCILFEHLWVADEGP